MDETAAGGTAGAVCAAAPAIVENPRKMIRPRRCDRDEQDMDTLL
jgi:hypothetical protein